MAARSINSLFRSRSFAFAKSLQRPSSLFPCSSIINLQQSSSFATLNKASLKELRAISGAPLKECKKALQEKNGNVEEALDWLRIEGVATARKKSDQVAANGFVVAMTHEDSESCVKYGSMAEVNCVTDFVENNPIFQNAATNIGNTILLSDDIAWNSYQDISQISKNVHVIPTQSENDNDNESEIVVGDDGDGESEHRENQTVGEALTDIIGAIRENLVIKRAFRMRANPQGVIGSYVHSRTTPNLGMKCSLIALETDSIDPISMNHNKRTYQVLQTLANNIAIHAVANQPQPRYVSRDDISEWEIDRERDILLEQTLRDETEHTSLDYAQDQVDVKMEKFYRDQALLDQPYCLDDDNRVTVQRLINKTSKQLQGLKIRVSQMVVFNLGQNQDSKDFREEPVTETEAE